MRKRESMSKHCKDLFIYSLFSFLDFCDLCFGGSEGAGLVAEALCHEITSGTKSSAV